MFKQWKRIIAILSTVTLLVVGAGSALAQEHNHSHQKQETSRLSLNNGKKWTTDANLRQAMAGIRDALSHELHAIHSGKATAEQYRLLAAKTNDQITFIVKNCKLDQKTDAMFHLLLSEIIAGADAMAGQDMSKARNGAEKIAHALHDYASYFDHPGWRGLE